MSSVGGFRKVEIDGKPFFIFTLLTQPNNPSSSEATTVSRDDNDFLQPPLFICPVLRWETEELERKDTGGDPSAPIIFSPHFPTTTSGDQQIRDLLDSDNHDDICKLPVSPLSWCNNQESADGEFRCYVCRTTARGTNYYFCVTCKETFHRECVESPSHITDHSYPFLYFQLSYPKTPFLECFGCKAQICGISYYCPTSNLSMHPICAMKPIPFAIDHPKRHAHPLTLFPKQAYLSCIVCGMIKESIPTYVCLPCVFTVHQDCVYSPTVIRISRHPHRISFTSSLPSGKWSCGVCRKAVDKRYGAYSCSKCDGYFVHTRCALRKDLWNGEELEGIPEEPEIAAEPFEVIAEGIILHFSHGHHLKMEVSRLSDKDMFCQACVLPIYKGNYYSCMDQCDFILHEACANAPYKKYHPLHAHPLTLKVVTNQYNGDQGYFYCDACGRTSCGFVYTSDEGRGFSLDIRCASVSEPFEYQGHEHPLYIDIHPGEEKLEICQVCQEKGATGKLNCIICDYVICFRCATFPYMARYEDDKHYLKFFEGKEIGDHSSWCEICERKIVDSTKEGLYRCNDCCISLHINCLLGEDLYMKPDHTIRYYGMELNILRNDILFRPFCSCCKQHCPHRVIFQKNNEAFCSFRCAVYFTG